MKNVKDIIALIRQFDKKCNGVYFEGSQENFPKYWDGYYEGVIECIEILNDNLIRIHYDVNGFLFGKDIPHESGGSEVLSSIYNDIKKKGKTKMDEQICNVVKKVFVTQNRKLK